MPPTAAQELANLPQGGVLYEPRSLWSFISVPITGQPQLVRMNRDHLYNGGKYPITLERMAVDAWNYNFEQNNDENFPWQDTSSIRSLARIAVSAPFKYHYSREPILMSSIPIVATGQVTGAAPLGIFHSSLHGICALEFSRPMYLPNKNVINWDLSAAYAIDGAPFDQESDANINVTQCVQQQGGLFSGYARTRRFELRQLETNFPPAGIDPEVPYAGWPYPPAAFTLEGPGDGNQFWDPAAAFNAQEWTEQDATRAGSDCFLGMRVAIDQIDVDELAEGGVTPAMYASRVGHRARIQNAGSGEWWWRPGAPLSVTLDSITPARVTKFDVPITLAPHDTLDVEVAIPAFPNPGDLPAREADRMFNLVLSFNGWAAIEG